MCYANDILVMIGGCGWHEILHLGELATACTIRAVPECRPCKVGGDLVLRQEQTRDSSADKHGKGSCPSGIADEESGSHHR